MNVKLTGLILAITVLFFVVVGYDVFLSQNRSLKRFGTQDPPELVKSQIAKEKDLRRRNLRLPRIQMSSSVAEQRYTAALDELREREIARNQRRYEKQRIRDFVKTAAGEHLIKGLNFLSEGDQKAAREYITTALSMHNQFEFSEYVMMLKGLLHTYVQKDDRDQLDKAVMNYLRVIQGQYTDMGFQRAINEFIDALQEKLIDE